MKSSLSIYFKILFLAGAIILFVSLFLEWYSFQMFEDGIITVSWSYNILFEWSTNLPLGFTSNENNRPEDLGVSYIINILYLAVLLFTIYTVLFQDLERIEDLGILKRYSLGFVCLIILQLFYICIFPLIYLLPNELYFPSLIEINTVLNLKFSYSISYGYILLVIGFLLVFPYSLHYYLTIIQFEKQESTPDKKIEEYLKKFQEPIDIDRYIAEEEALS